MFDLNYDGKMSALEHAIELQLIDTITKNNAEDDIRDDEDDGNDDELTELELAGIESEELEYMDDEARKEVLEEDGLDPDEYDF